MIEFDNNLRYDVTSDAMHMFPLINRESYQCGRLGYDSNDLSYSIQTCEYVFLFLRRDDICSRYNVLQLIAVDVWCLFEWRITTPLTYAAIVKL